MPGFNLPFGKFTLAAVGGYGGTPVTGSCPGCDYKEVRPAAVLGFAACGASIKVICLQCGYRATLAEFVIKQDLCSSDPQDRLHPAGSRVDKDSMPLG